MNWFDIAIIVVIFGSTFLGLKIGLVRAAVVLAAFIIAAGLAAQLSVQRISILEKLIENQDVREMAVFTAVFILAFAAINIVGGIICKIINFTPLKWIDQLIGGVLGLLAGIVLIGLGITYLAKSPTSNSEEWLEGSALAPIIKSIVGPILQEFRERKSEISIKNIVYQLSALRLFLS